ncbi:hypothetical protein QQM79_07495 [Marinobacteraceae bacterium S3BR75-40.1]
MRARFLGLLFTVLALPAHAVELFFSPDQLNPMIRAGFPVHYQTADYQVTLTNPHLALKEQGQHVSVRAHIAVDDNGKPALRGTATVEGELAYSQSKGQLHLIEPTLKTLDIDQISQDLKPTVDQLNMQLLSRPLPMILLVDLKQLSQGLPVNGLKDVRIQGDSLVVQF